MSRSIASLLGLASVLLVQGATAQADPSAATVALQFGWPVGLEADVDARTFRLRSASGRADTTEATVTYHMTVRPHESGRLIEYADFEMAVRNGTAPASGFMDRLTQQIGAMQPAYVVTHDGAFLRLHDFEPIQRMVRSLVQPLFDSLGSTNAEAARIMERMLSEPYFAARAAEDWNAMVGLWVGAEFEVGALYESESEEPSPLFPQVTLPFTYQFALTERVPCTTTAPGPECVVLEMESFPDPDAMKSLLTDMLGRLAGRQVAGRVVYEEFDIQNTVSLIAEPATLKPYRLEVAQRISGAGRDGDGPREEFSQTQLRSYAFTYRSR